MKHDVLIIGAGFSGLAMARELFHANINYTILEKETALGGTWRENRYPGCGCDISGTLYAFTGIPNKHSRSLYPTQVDMLEYLRDVARTFDIDRHIHFDEHVAHIIWDAAQKVWVTTTQSGKSYRSTFVVTAVGALHVPYVPHIPGMATYKGKQWHSARWPEDVTFAGKRVAVVGSGASAIQMVPEIQKTAARVHIFQRTPAWIVPRKNHCLSATELALNHSLPLYNRLKRFVEKNRREIIGHAFIRDGLIRSRIKKAAMDNLEQNISDPMLRMKLTPSYEIGCKRILLSDNYYPALSSANVFLTTSAIQSITPSGLIACDGTTHHVDHIVWATGFNVTDFLPAMRIAGHRGIELHQQWQSRPAAYMGISVPDFPNFFILLGPNTGLGHTSVLLMIEAQANFIRRMVQKTKRSESGITVVKESAMSRYQNMLQSKLAGTVWNTGLCTSWHLTQEGKNVGLWPGSAREYGRLLRHRAWSDFDFSP